MPLPRHLCSAGAAIAGALLILFAAFGEDLHRIVPGATPWIVGTIGGLAILTAWGLRR